MPSERPWQDEDTLSEAYSRHHSTRKVASELGCGKETVRRWMERFGIERTGRKHNVAVTERSDGYEQLTVNIDGKTHSCLHHRLLAVAKFGYDAVVGNDVHHTNSMKLDNRLENIEVLSRSDHTTLHNENAGMTRNELGQFVF
ncbi:HNH endonuclease [Halorubrum phage HRTV-17]|uniref:HNH endonuclease n=2 Tax=Haloferacalesvirus hv8 TaxID=1273755 RepID=A0AAE8XRD4_9CAUD|nr:HNH endonuclease [Halorubrum phage HRTV-14]UBF19252.1 HNH endonuclease [Halorubrum phage HRTV-17]